jgi:O-antigen/teichoic acid export membrane protein
MSLLHAERPLRITRAVAWQAAGTAFCAAISFLLVLVLARVLGPADFGGYIWLLSVAVLVLIPIEGGWPTLLYRDSAEAEVGAHGSTGAAVRHVLLASLAAASIAALMQGAALAVAMICMGTVALANLVSARLRGAGRFDLDALWQSSGRGSSALAILLCVHALSSTPTAIFGAWSLSLLVLLLLWGRHRLAAPARPQAGYAVVLPFLAIDAGTALLLRGDMALLGYLPLSPEALASYAVGTRFTELSVLALAPLSNVLLRALRRARHDAAGFARLRRNALAAAFALGAAVAIATVGIGEPLVRLLFGPDYLAAVPLLPWTLAAAPLLLCNLVLIQAGIANGRERRCAVALGIGAVTLLAAVSCGAWLFDVRGAAAGAALAQALAAVALWRNSSERQGSPT